MHRNVSLNDQHTMNEENRTYFEKDILIKAIDAFGRKFIVISPEFTILAANRFSKRFYPTDVVNQKCYEVLYKQSRPCDGCPAFESLNTSNPSIKPEKKAPVDPDKIPFLYAYP